MTKHVSFLTTLLLLFWLGACRQQELQPTATDNFPGVPEAVVRAVTTAYPAATKLTFTELDKNNVWESAFSVQSVEHQAKVSTKGVILEAYAVGSAGGEKGPANQTLPEAARAYIARTYPAHKVVAVGEGEYNGKKAYKVLLRTEKEEVTLLFDAQGVVFLEFKATITPKPGTAAVEAPKSFPITKVEELPAVASQYLQANGLTFAKGMATVDKEGKKTFLVIATKGTTVSELWFDANGKLIRSGSSTLPSPAPVVSELKSLNDLPEAAARFLAGYTLVKGAVVTKEGQKTYTVLVQKDGKQFEMAFDSAGKVLYNKPVSKLEEKVIDSAKDLPAAIKEYLTKTYPNWVFMKGIVVLQDGKASRYTVVIKSGDTLYYVYFNGEGKFEIAKKG